MKARPQDPWNQYYIKSGEKNKIKAQNKITAARGDENDEQSVIYNSCDSLKCFKLDTV